MFRAPFQKSYDQCFIVPEISSDLSGYVETTTFSTTSTLLSIDDLNNKINFSNLYVSGSSTFSSSLNVSGRSTLNNVNILGD